MVRKAKTSVDGQETGTETPPQETPNEVDTTPVVATKPCKDECGVLIPLDGVDYTNECYAKLQRAQGLVPCICHATCGTWTDPSKGPRSRSCHYAYLKAQDAVMFPEQQLDYARGQRNLSKEEIEEIRDSLPDLDLSAVDEIFLEGRRQFSNRRFVEAGRTFSVALVRVRFAGARHCANLIAAKKKEFQLLLDTCPELKPDVLINQVAVWGNEEEISKILNQEPKLSYSKLTRGVKEMERILIDLKDRLDLFLE